MHALHLLGLWLLTAGPVRAQERGYTDICKVDVAAVGTIVDAVVTERPGTREWFTRATLQIEAQYRGPPMVELPLAAPGGEKDGHVRMAMGGILLADGMRYVVFIRFREPGENPRLAGWQRISKHAELPEPLALGTYDERLCATHPEGIASIRQVAEDFDPSLVPPSLLPLVSALVADHRRREANRREPSASDVRAAKRAKAIMEDPSILFPPAKPSTNE